jgi:hypothetical protein
MADVEEPTACEACGRQLPLQHGKGRRRRYCDATCRSAARRARETGSPGAATGVKLSLTPSDRQEYVDGVAETSNAAVPVAVRVGDAARRLVAELTGSGAGSPLAAVTAASELSAATNAALQEAVDRARAAGHSWREIGDVLETTRQAAFQRFGRPVDPRTGKPMLRAVPRGTADRAIGLFADIVEGRWEAATKDFTPQMLEHVDAGRIADAYAQTVSMVGGFERMGEPLAYPVSLGASVDIPLHFEAGERTGQVTFDRNGNVIGLFIRPPQS